MENRKILFGITGSFCNHQAIIKVLEELTADNEIQVVLTKNVVACSTRFYNAIDFQNDCERITGQPLIKDIVEAEKVGPRKYFDCMVIAPMSANSVSKLVNGAYDCPVALAAKAMLRNQKPIICGIATNDALGISGKNIFTLLALKNIYYVPFAQDDPMKKPNSLVADWSLIAQTCENALMGVQLQPLLRQVVFYEK